MEPELWGETSAAISAVALGWERHAGDRHCTPLIVRVYHWACLHDRPISWACKPKHWTPSTRPEVLPSQSTMSRRARREDFERVLKRVSDRMNSKAQPSEVKEGDGQTLVLPNHRNRPAAASSP